MSKVKKIAAGFIVANLLNSAKEKLKQHGVTDFRSTVQWQTDDICCIAITGDHKKFTVESRVTLRLK